MRPQVQSILVADRIYKDVITGVDIIVGVFDVVEFTSAVGENSDLSFPSNYMIPKTGYHGGTPFLYLRIHDVLGKNDFNINIVSLQDNIVLMNSNFSIDSDDRLKFHTIIKPLPPFSKFLNSNSADFWIAYEIEWMQQTINTFKIRIKRKEDTYVAGQ